MEEEQTEWLSVKQAAALRGVRVQRINRMINEGRLPATRIGSYWAIRRSDIEGYEKQKPGPKPRLPPDD